MTTLEAISSVVVLVIGGLMVSSIIGWIPGIIEWIPLRLPHVSLTKLLWLMCAVCALSGCYVMHRGGWMAVISNPFPIRIYKQVWQTNYVYTPTWWQEERKGNDGWVTNAFYTNLSVNTFITTNRYLTNYWVTTNYAR